jgi:hypothetical protein
VSCRLILSSAKGADARLFRAVDQFDVAEDEPLNPDSVAYIVKRAVERIGLEVADLRAIACAPASPPRRR